jgi:flavin reductase (DIM6/NTAB) family NADH-FMN oxidoreductase RutF
MVGGMNTGSSAAVPAARAAGHVTIAPAILYFGTPVVLLSTENQNGSFNLAPMSSAWALGQVVVLGLGAEGQTARNLRNRPDLVISVPAPEQWQAVERLAPLTGRSPVPDHKQRTFRFEPEKFAAADLEPEQSELVRPPRVAECPLQMEARAADVRPGITGEFLLIQVQVLQVHADPCIVVPGSQHIDPARWSPLIYNFRHYYGLGTELGHSFRSQTHGHAHALPAAVSLLAGGGRVRSLRPAERPGAGVEEPDRQGTDRRGPEGPAGMTADVGEIEKQRRYDEGSPAGHEVGNGPVTEPAGIPLLRDAGREVRETVGGQQAAGEAEDYRLPHAGNSLAVTERTSTGAPAAAPCRRDAG